MTIEDDHWRDDADRPGRNTTHLAQALAALDDAGRGEGNFLRAEVLELDRALLYYELGRQDEANEIVKRLPNVSVEVVELLHDAGVAVALRPSLLRLITLLADGDDAPDHLDSLREDVTDSEAPEWDAAEVDFPLREPLNLSPTPGFLAAERVAETSDQGSEGVSTAVRRIVRLVRAANYVPGIDLTAIARRLIDQLPGETDAEMREADAVLVDVLKACASSEHGGTPMLAEVVAAVLLDRRDVAGALIQALDRDNELRDR